jgi:hypothetical protein
VAGGRPGVTCRKPVLVATVTARAAGCGMPAAGRPAVARGQVAEHAAAAGRRAPAADVRAAAVGCTQVSGARVTMSVGRRPDFVMCVDRPAGEQLAELQLTLGEGPSHHVLESAAPVLAADLGDESSGRPRTEGGLHVPAVDRAIRAGVIGLYRGSPGPLPGTRLGDALILADAATLLLLDGLRPVSPDHA